MQGGGILIFIVVAAVIVVAIVAGIIAERKRREAFVQLARELGFSFSPDHDESLADRFHFVDKISQGSNRYAYNVLRGALAGESVLIFDYHYETYSTDSKGRRTTHHHHMSVFLLLLAGGFPELTVSHEGFFSKIAQAFGYDDIDFESHEFSRKFCVRSRDKKFAYDVCNARMIEYLLDNTDLTIEIEGHALALVFDSRLSPSEVRYNLDRLEAIRERIPAYLFTTT